MTVQEFTTEELNNEVWRDVVGYEGVYSVSDIGRVRRDLGGNSWNAIAGRILKLKIDKYGYAKVNLCKNGVIKGFTVHKLVAAAFIGVCPEGMQINHINPKTGKADNRASNLEYCTGLQNMQHAAQNGLMASGDRSFSRTHPERLARGDRHGSRTHPEKLLHGEKNGRSKVKDADIPVIFDLYEKGLLQREIGVIVGLGQTQVSNILRRKCWGGTYFVEGMG